MTEEKTKTPENLMVWGHILPGNLLTQEQTKYMRNLPSSLPSVYWLWGEMNKVWDSLGLDNRKRLSDQADLVSRFYSHPVWIVNGIFTAADTQSRDHRSAIAAYVGKMKAKKISDFGGGFGELALILATSNPEATISVIEPFPSKIGTHRMSSEPHIKIVSNIPTELQDVVIAQDVLEHVDDPITLAYQLASSVKPGGILLFANCFHPMIHCHLPATFYLRHTFSIVMRRMGVRYIGRVAGAPSVRVYRRQGELSNDKAQSADVAAKTIGPFLNIFAAFIYWLATAVRLK